MIVCPRCKRRMGRDHRCSRMMRRHFFFGLLGGMVAVAAKLKPTIPQMLAMKISGTFNTRTVSTSPTLNNGIWMYRGGQP